MNNSNNKRNLIISLGFIIFLFIFLLIGGIIVESKTDFLQTGSTSNIVFSTIFVLIFPSIFFVLAYFGIRKKYTFPKEIGALIIFTILSMFFSNVSAKWGFKIALLSTAIVILPLIIFLKDIVSLDEKSYAKRIGIVYLIWGLLVFGLFLEAFLRHHVLN